MANEQIVPSGDLASRFADPEAPAHYAGGFLVAPGESGKRSLITPTDTCTGLPFSIVPTEDILPKDRPRVADAHHHFHPASDPVLKTVAGAALRNCRLQLVSTAHHNQGRGSYHAYFKGPNLPTDPLEQFKTCVYACAGFMPRHGIDMSSGAPELVELTKKQMAQLQVPGADDEFGYRNLWYNYEPVRRFFTNFALEQDFGLIKRQKLGEFLLTTDEKRKQHLARGLIGAAARLAVDSMKDEYSMLHRAGQLHPNIQSDPTVLVYFKIRNRPVPSNLTPRVERRALAALQAA